MSVALEMLLRDTNKRIARLEQLILGTPIVTKQWLTLAEFKEKTGMDSRQVQRMRNKYKAHNIAKKRGGLGEYLYNWEAYQSLLK